MIGANGNAVFQQGPGHEAFMVRQQKLLVHNGHHYDEKMPENLFVDLRIPRPTLNLGRSGSHDQQTFLATRGSIAFADLQTVPLGTTTGGLSDRTFAVLTLHRPSNVDSPFKLASILDAVLDNFRRAKRVSVHSPHAGRWKEFGLTSQPGGAPKHPRHRALSYLLFLGLSAGHNWFGPIAEDLGGNYRARNSLSDFTARHGTSRPLRGRNKLWWFIRHNLELQIFCIRTIVLRYLEKRRASQ